MHCCVSKFVDTFGLVWFGFGLVLVWFWFGFGLVLVWFWFGCFCARRRHAVRRAAVAVTQDFHDDSWPLLRAHLDIAAAFAPLIGANGTYPDLDMLALGRQARSAGPPSPCLFTPAEQTLVMTLWAITRAPLIIGAVLPLDAGDAWTLGLLTHADVLRVNNETSGNAPVAVVVPPGNSTAGLHAWAARDESGAGGAVVALFNAGDAPASVGVDVPAAAARTGAALPARVPVCAVDVWTGAAVPGSPFESVFAMELGAHAAGLYRLVVCPATGSGV